MPNGFNETPNNISRNLLNTQNNMANRSQNTLPGQTLPNGSANGQNNVPAPWDSNIANQELAQMNPQLYSQIKPHIDAIVKQLQNQDLSEDMIDSIVDEIMQRSGISEDYMNEDMESAIATYARMYPYYYPRRRRRRYPRYYGPMTPEAWIRLLLLQQLEQYLF